ncbi:uncharacterized protein N7459_008509 [Penicillium hispanicum]|uniref:uncharacterized protein n=1 Tax=Penicillium hispanicum TaxID=1080232 RepID=UPI002541920D|nr:uncharacterized protein N7459_008509 [Penicillium hispanicum]KAJ5574082.1 hypothetical protein N7459_008509 [Penicillium hispanicum]
MRVRHLLQKDEASANPNSKILDPQAAVLTNVEVLAYLSSNPPRRPPNPPPNSNPRQWVPSPDLRDHNTVVKEVRYLYSSSSSPIPSYPSESLHGTAQGSSTGTGAIMHRSRQHHLNTTQISTSRPLTNSPITLQIHNYVSRISPHILRYPRHTLRPSSSASTTQAAMTGTMRPTTTTGPTTSSNIPPPIPPPEPTPLDRALRDLIMNLQPYGLTKAEVVMILNLGVGLTSASASAADGTGDGEMDVDEEHAHVNGVNGDSNGNSEENGEAAEEEADWGALALFESVVEEREERIRDEDVPVVLRIIRETLDENYGS